ncbi:hypothetical protein PC110_g4782 [Phytophthora cactorum]|uniref:Uncharacterized protein n=1 Tax=Phytophthora cactorum TaxID=29920 RepID=A0A329SQ14_9STRA|nr:hypothetical protein PC110_g4782 [Phytophthora cactorum]
MLFVGASKPSSYVFPLVPHAATSDLPGGKTYSQEEAILYWERLEEKDNEVEEPPAKRVRGRPNVSKYINDLIMLVSDRLTKLRTQTRHRSSRFSGSSRVDLGCSTRSPKLSRTWGTITREDQSVGKVLTGYKDPHLPCVTPSVTTLKELLSELEYAHLLTLRGQIFKNVSGFTDASLNVDTAVLNAALAALLIHLENVATASRRRRSSRSPTFTAFMKPSIPRMLLWVRVCRSAPVLTRGVNFVRRGRPRTTHSLGNALVVTRIFLPQPYHRSWRRWHQCCARCRISWRCRKPHQVVPSPNQHSAVAAAESSAPPRTDVVVEAHSLAGCLYNWYTLKLWHTATQKKQQFVRADLKACINIMIIAVGRDVDVLSAPLERDGVAHQLWKQTPWTLAESLGTNTNTALGNIDGKGRSKNGRLAAKTLEKKYALSTDQRTTHYAQPSSPARQMVALSIVAHPTVTNGSRKTWSCRDNCLAFTP